MTKPAVHCICPRLTFMTRNPNLVRNPLAEMCLALRLSGLRRLPHRVYRVLGRLLGKGQTERLFSSSLSRKSLGTAGYSSIERCVSG